MAEDMGEDPALKEEVTSNTTIKWVTERISMRKGTMKLLSSATLKLSSATLKLGKSAAVDGERVSAIDYR